PNHRELIRIVVLDGLSYEEAAKALGVSIGTVRSRLSRARTELRNHEARPRTPVRRVDGGQPPEPRSRLSPPEPAMAPEAPVAPEPAMAPEPTTAPAAASRVVAAVPPPSGALAVWRLSSRPVAPRADRLAGTRVVGLRRSAYRQSPGPNAGRRTPLFTERSTGRPCRIGAGSRMAGLPWSRDGPRPRAAP
ncbi:MAG TPA: sigma factor-like helix-turn-helix DNA-binding protein, partial [Azospirillum sp.]|nr:sigma factor-like helix-turn-helix DNA-binding protein [Azospirillum sp.]